MERWVRHLAKQIAAGGLCLTVLAGMLHGLGPLEVLLRGAVIGLVLYFAIVLVGGLIGQALLRLAVEQHAAAVQEQKERARERAAAQGLEEEDEDEDEDAGEEASAPSVRGDDVGSAEDHEAA